LADSSTADLEERMKTEWKQFVEADFPKILDLIRSIKWDSVAQTGSAPA